MSVASEKGKGLEEDIAKLLRKKLGARVERDKRSGAGSHQKMDLTNYYQDIPLDIEAKNHKTIKIGEWYRQAKAGASVGRVPTVVFNLDGDMVAALPFPAVVDLLLEIKQLQARVNELSAPVPVAGLDIGAPKGDKSVKQLVCRGGNLVSPGGKKCLVKGCTYCHPKKEKKG